MSSSAELVSNRKAFFDYEILETFEAGIVLLGTEIKSLRNHGGSMQDAYAVVQNDEVWLLNMSIAPYRFDSLNMYTKSYEDRRKRKLLLHKREIRKVNIQLKERGLSLIPIAAYLKDGKAKIKLGLAKGKKTVDKRETIQKREHQRAMESALKGRTR